MYFFWTDSPLSSQPVSVHILCQQLTTALLEGREGPQKIFHDQFLRKNCAGPDRYQTHDRLITSWTRIQLRPDCWMQLCCFSLDTTWQILLWILAIVYKEVVVYSVSKQRNPWSGLSLIQKCLQDIFLAWRNSIYRNVQNIKQLHVDLKLRTVRQLKELRITALGKRGIR